VSPDQLVVAMVAEMIHTASLVHDDITMTLLMSHCLGEEIPACFQSGVSIVCYIHLHSK